MKVVLLCTPSTVILDNWISILYDLKQKIPQAEFIFLSPKTGTLDEIDTDANLIKISDEIFNTVVFRTELKKWCYAQTFSEAKNINRKFKVPSLIGSFQKRLRQLGLGKIANVFQKAVTFSKTKNYSKHTYSLSQLSEIPSVLLFDLYEINKGYNVSLLKQFDDLPKFSLLHGLNFRGVNGEVDRSLVSPKIPKKTTALLYSPDEVEFYHHYYKLPKSKLRVLGIPRHDPEWVNFLISKESEKDLPFEDGFIFVISRPSHVDKLPRSRKLKAIEAVKCAAEKHKLPIVVKFHPKEKNDGTYEEVLGTQVKGKTWDYSNAHPFVLGSRCIFAVSFNSGVPVDMIRMGVPTVEYLDLKGLKHYDHDNALRDESGELVWTYRYRGLVLGASNIPKFMSQVDRVMSEKDKVVEQLQSAYKKYYPEIPNVNEITADEIASTLQSQ